VVVAVAATVVATVAVVVIVPTLEADVVVHAEELMFLQSTTPRHSPAWAHSTPTHMHVLTNTVCTARIF